MDSVPGGQVTVGGVAQHLGVDLGHLWQRAHDAMAVETAHFVLLVPALAVVVAHHAPHCLPCSNHGGRT
jgi:hypothetical protein